MHEAGIATAVLAEIRARGIDPGAARLVVSGGHGDADAFDAALRAHLAAAAPDLDVARIAIEHAAVSRLCAHCATPFEAPLASDPCPACGGPGIAVPVPERVELEWVSGERLDIAETAHDEPDRTRLHDSRPSFRDGSPRDASGMRRPDIPVRS